VLAGKSRPNASAVLDQDLVHITPHPVLSRLDGLDDGVMGRMKMLRCMLVLRRIATSDVAANPAEPQVDPGVAGFEALLTPVRVRFHVLNLIRVGTFHDLWAERKGAGR
jgi:hypothetical protein